MANRDLTQLEHLTDGELLQLSLSSPCAFEILLTRYQKPFLRKAVSILKNADEAEDAVQDTFIRIYRFADKFSHTPDANFKAWGYTILMNVLFTKLAGKKRTRSRVAELEPEDYERLPDTTDVFKDLSLQDYVASVFSRISDDARKVLTLYYLEGKSQGEIAASLGTSVGAVKIKVFRARQAFKSASRVISS